MLPAIITEHQTEIDALCREYRVRRLELFGSAATGDWDAASSDLDFLVRFDPEARWTARFDLAEALQQLFERDVDLVADQEFENPYFRQSVEDSRTHLWGECRQAPDENGVRVSGKPVNHALKYLWDIHREIGYLRNTIAGLDLETVRDNIMLLRSLQMHLMIIGESLNQLSTRDAAVFERISNAGGFIGQRNVLIHQYRDLDWERIWGSVQQEIPLLFTEVDGLIAELDPEARRS